MARFGIVAIFSHIILNPCIVFRVSLLWQESLGDHFFFEKKQRVIAERQTFFKNAEVQPSFCSAKFLLSQVLQIPQLHRQKNSFN